jgi:hypothetical protein
MALRVADHRELLNRILNDHKLASDTLELVPDVQKWCREYGIHENSPFRQAKCLCCYSNSACHIVMVDVLMDDAISSGKSAMECRGLVSEVATLDTDIKYLIHLMLHEVACYVLRSTEQEPRDKWAFERVSMYAI